MTPEPETQTEHVVVAVMKGKPWIYDRVAGGLGQTPLSKAEAEAICKKREGSIKFMHYRLHVMAIADYKAKLKNGDPIQ